MSQFPVCRSCGNLALRAFENLRPLIWLAVQFLFRCSLCFWLLRSLCVLGFPRLQLRGSIVHRGGSIHREVCVLECAEVEVLPVVPSQEIRSDKWRVFTSSPASFQNASSAPSSIGTFCPPGQRGRRQKCPRSFLASVGQPANKKF